MVTFKLKLKLLHGSEESFREGKVSFLLNTNHIQAAKENKNDVNLNLVILVISSKDYQKRATNGHGYNGLEIMSTLL